MKPDNDDSTEHPEALAPRVFVLGYRATCPECGGSLQDSLKPDGLKCRVCGNVYVASRKLKPN